MTDYTTKDEFAAIDAEFHACYYKMRECLNEDLPITDEVEDAADRMFDIAIQLGDRMMLAFCLEIYSAFIKQKRTPPWTMLEQLHEAFLRYRSPEAGSLDSAFNLIQPDKKNRSRWTDRARARHAAAMIEVFGVFDDMSDSKAIEAVEVILNEKDLRRTYSKYRRIVKSK